MKNTKGFLGIVVFIGCLWLVVVGTYAANVGNENGNLLQMIPMTSQSCSSSTTSSKTE